MDGARSMLERGDLLVPYYRGHPFFDKPALTYWLMAASFRALGFTPGSARLVSAGAAAGVLLATLALGTLLLGRRSALLGAALLSTTLAFLSFGRVAMSDMLLTLWSTLAVALAVRACRPGPPAWAVPALGAVLGLGFLTKGPIALVLPGLGILLALARSRDSRPPITPRAGALALLLFVLCGLGWFVALYVRLGWDPLAYFFLRENLQRFASETYDAGREWWFYLPAYLAVGMPWSPFLPAALSCQLRDDLAARDLAGPRLLAVWAGLMLVPLSLSRGKIDYYLLPALPPVSLVMGHYFAEIPWRRFERVWARACLLPAATALAAVAIGPFWLPAEWLPGPAARWALTLVAGAGALACAWSGVRARPLRIVATLATATAAVWLVLAAAFLPAFRDAQPNALIVEDVSRELRYRPDATVAVCEDPTRVQRDLLFFARVAVTERCDLWNPAASRFPFLLLLSSEEFASLDSVMARVRLVRRYPYLPARVLSLKGLLAPPRPEGMFLAANYVSKDPVAKERRRLERQAERSERGRQIHLRLKAQRGR
jgi:4-amino-4-deoxy-L-arabinose transferase-like glycosyltransferase